MTITASIPDYLAWGNIKYDATKFSQTSLNHFTVIADIANNDLYPNFSPPAGQSNNFYIAWCFYLYGSQLLSNSYRFKSALPKYDLGNADIAFRGSQTDSINLNFLAQRSPVYKAWDTDAGTDYPSPYIEPTPIEVGFESAQNLSQYFFNAPAGNYGTDLYVQLTGLQISDDLQLVVYYQANNVVLSVPYSLGDI